MPRPLTETTVRAASKVMITPTTNAVGMMAKARRLNRWWPNVRAFMWKNEEESHNRLNSRRGSRDLRHRKNHHRPSANSDAFSAAGELVTASVWHSARFAQHKTTTTKITLSIVHTILARRLRLLFFSWTFATSNFCWGHLAVAVTELHRMIEFVNLSTAFIGPPIPYMSCWRMNIWECALTRTHDFRRVNGKPFHIPSKSWRNENMRTMEFRLMNAVRTWASPNTMRRRHYALIGIPLLRFRSLQYR